MTSKLRNWVTGGIIFFTFIMVFLPGMIASGLVQKYIVGITGGLSILLQVLLLTRSDMEKKYRTQSLLVLVLTLAAMALMFVLYSA